MEELVKEARVLLAYAPSEGITDPEVGQLCFAFGEESTDPLQISYRLRSARGQNQASDRPNAARFTRRMEAVWGLAATSFLFFFLAVGNQMADTYIADRIDPSEDRVCTR